MRGNPFRADRGFAWWTERSALVLTSIVLVLSAANGTASGRIVFVACCVIMAALVVYAWYREDVTTGEVLFFAVLIRFLAFPLLPGLSDDGYRYVWDGWLQLDGVNPYLVRPVDTSLDFADYRDLLDLLNSKTYYSVYPPASQLVFLVGGFARDAGWVGSWFGIKLCFLALELGGLWALSRMVSAHLLLLYAWHPLAIVELAGQGHTEAGMVGFLLVAFWAISSRHPAVAVGAITVAGWFKLYPLLLLPFILRRVGWRYVWVAVVASIPLVSLYAAPRVIAHIGESLNLYVELFEFNAGPYFALKHMAYAWSGEDISKVLGPALRNLFLIGIGALFVADHWRRWHLAWVWCAAIGMLWMTSTTIHPWYLVGILAVLPLTLNASNALPTRLHAVAWIWLSVASMGTYLLYAVSSGPYWVFVWVGWSGWLIGMASAGSLAVLPWLMRYRGTKKWSWLRTHLGSSGRVLDVGAGEGYVGAAARQTSGLEVQLVDVVDFNRTDLPLTVYDGHHLPFDDETFDAALLVFVLHHTEDVAAVINEVRRVTRRGGRVGVVESVVENRFDAWWLPFADRLANRLRSGGRMTDQEEHLHFRSAPEWRSYFQRAGFEVLHEQRRGRLLHKQALFILTH